MLRSQNSTLMKKMMYFTALDGPSTLEGNGLTCPLLMAVADLLYPIFTAGNLEQLCILKTRVEFLLSAKQSASVERQTGSANNYTQESAKYSSKYAHCELNDRSVLAFSLVHSFERGITPTKTCRTDFQEDCFSPRNLYIDTWHYKILQNEMQTMGSIAWPRLIYAIDTLATVKTGKYHIFITAASILASLGKPREQANFERQNCTIN